MGNPSLYARRENNLSIGLLELASVMQQVGAQ